MEIPCDQDCELESDRLLLSPMLCKDAEPLFGLLKEPSLHSFIGGRPPSNLEVLCDKITLWEKRQSPAGDEVWLNWTVRQKLDGVAVGYIQATIKLNQAELAWVIGIPFQKQGYAVEATRTVLAWLMNHFKIRQLRANIHPDNLPSQSVAKHIGLQRTFEVTEEGENVWAALCSRDMVRK